MTQLREEVSFTKGPIIVCGKLVKLLDFVNGELLPTLKELPVSAKDGRKRVVRDVFEDAYKYVTERVEPTLTAVPLASHSSLAGRTPTQFAAITEGARRLSPARLHRTLNPRTSHIRVADFGGQV